MTSTMRSFGRLRRLLMVPLATGALVVAAAPQVLAQSDRQIEGVWAMQVTLRDCATNAVLAPPISTLFTFHQGGTVTESPGPNVFAAGQRTSGHGLWAHGGGPTFTSRVVGAILFETAPSATSPGFQSGWQTLTSKFTLTGPDHLTTSATVQFYTLERQLYRTVCPTGVGERFR